MTDYNNIECPCYGTLKEIHAALIGPLEHGGQQCTINGIGYTVDPAGFRSNRNGRLHAPEELERNYPPDGLGVAILVGFREKESAGEYVQIITTKKIPHVSKRCPECGDQLDQYEIEHYGACGSCYAEGVR